MVSPLPIQQLAGLNPSGAVLPFVVSPQQPNGNAAPQPASSSPLLSSGNAFGTRRSSNNSSVPQGVGVGEAMGSLPSPPFVFSMPPPFSGRAAPGPQGAQPVFVDRQGRVLMMAPPNVDKWQ